MPRFNTLPDWLQWQEKLHPRPIDLGLQRVAGVYRQLNPGHQQPLTITVAGTNGKGSSVAYLDAIYRAQGYRVGAYTSPHILRYNERIRINGCPVDDEAICEAFARIDGLRNDTSLSYFEFGTLAALDIFSRAELDVQLLEVGLGGRLDAVNIIDTHLALVTTISLDHTDWLGEDVEMIGREKAGIFRANVPAVVGDENPPQSLTTVADELGAELLRFGRDFSFQRQSASWNWQGLDNILQDLPLPAFKGEHQYRNASAVIMAVMRLQRRLPVCERAIHTGLQQAQLLGRFQLIDGDPPVLLDVGHNPQAVQSLCDYLGSQFPDVKIHAVFAMMKDKDIASAVDIMRARVVHWYLAPLNNSRAMPVEAMHSLLKRLQIDAVTADFEDAPAAFEAARQQAQSGELVVIFGSFFLVSEYLSNKS